jgi:hypothetical protein
VTALDPAFPNFYPDGATMRHIRATDAIFVDIIHTDAGQYGAPYTTGTADFWPNGGKAPQPGCPLAIPLTESSMLILLIMPISYKVDVFYGDFSIAYIIHTVFVIFWQLHF